MAFSYRRLFFGGNTFCCCLPVRMGVISMSLFGCLVAGLLTVLLWFEISSTTGMTSDERAAFILAALTETVLFAASILGLVGAIVRKQSFTQIYAYILYIHFIINLGIAAYLLYEITRISRNAEALACQTAIQDPQAQGQCTGLLTFARWVYLVIAGTVLLVEMYGAVIATRYLNQLQREKGTVRAMQRDTVTAFELKTSMNGHHYARLHDSANQKMLPPLEAYHLHPSDTEYNPYEETTDPPRDADLPSGIYVDRSPPIEVGYGGGSSTHVEIVAEEKARLKQRGMVAEVVSVLNSPVDGAFREQVIGVDLHIEQSRNEGNILPICTQPPPAR